MKQNSFKVFLKAWFGSTHAIKLLMQKNIQLGKLCCYSPFQYKNYYCKIINNYLAKNITKAEKFLAQKSESNPRLFFLLYNFLKTHRHLDKIEILNDYFHDKRLAPVRKIASIQPLYIDNIATPEMQKCDKKHGKVSVIITVYNCGSLVYHAVMSIINQTYTNIEIIVVNDGSSDNTLDILQTLKDKYPFIILISIQNCGTYVARNVGLSYVTGDYITFHDADDWAHPQRIEEHLKLHHDNPSIYASVSKYVRLMPDGFFFSPIIYPMDRKCIMSLMFSKKVFEEFGYYRTGRFGNDSEYYERLGKFADGGVVEIDKVLNICAQRPNSLTTTPETSNEIGKNSRRMHQMKRWRKWHKLCQTRNKKPYVAFCLDQSKVMEIQ